MGTSILNPESPVTKATNCIIAYTEPTNDAFTMPCIRCSRCAEVCPSELLPQQLYWTIQGQQLEEAKNYYLEDCIECGCCDYVCPSQIKLVDHFRYAKAQLKQQHHIQHTATMAKQRYEERNVRLQEKQKAKEQARAQKLASISEKSNSKQDKLAAIKAAVARKKGECP